MHLDDPHNHLESRNH